MISKFLASANLKNFEPFEQMKIEFLIDYCVEYFLNENLQYFCK